MATSAASREAAGRQGEGEVSGSARPGEPQQHSQQLPAIGDGAPLKEIKASGPFDGGDDDFNPQPLNRG